MEYLEPGLEGTSRKIMPYQSNFGSTEILRRPSQARIESIPQTITQEVESQSGEC